MPRQLLSLCVVFTAFSCSDGDRPHAVTALYVPPAIAAVVTKAPMDTTLDRARDPFPQPLPSRSFKVAPTLREGALRVLSQAQLDELDLAFLGRLDLHAFAAIDSDVIVWLDGAHVIAADVALYDGRRIRAAWFPGSSTASAGWYDQDGLSLASEILGRPVALSRVTSRFGERLHPISGTRKQHRGIDYGAPEGTPVFAVGDGVVVVAAADAAAGNHIKLRHRSGFESWYLHLHHFTPALQRGDEVKQGEVIGYVGTTGASTGPHLHYELHRNGLALDPQKKLALPLRALGLLSQPQHRKTLERFR